VEPSRLWKKDPLPDEIVTRLDADSGTTTLTLLGEVDVLTVDQVRVAMDEALAARPREVVVELGGLDFIDSTGLGALISGFQRARDAGIGFRLAHPSRAVHQILVLSGLLEVVELTP
jgi:anti-anti-sigma factor